MLPVGWFRRRVAAAGSFAGDQGGSDTEINATTQDFVEWIAEALRAEYELEGDTCTFKLGRQNVEKDIELGYIEEIIRSLSAKDKIEDTAIYDRHSYEVLVAQATPFLQRAWFGAQEIDLADEENGITYRIAPPSDEYLLFLLYEISKVSSLRFTAGRGRPTGRILDQQEEVMY